MFSSIQKLFAPPPAIERVPDEQVAPLYKKKRLQIMLACFIGYAGYYLVRTNLNLAKPYLIDVMGFSKAEVGLIASALTIAYGISKFVMGNVSDRSNPRIFLATGLFLSAVANFCFGFLPSIWILILLWFLNGWFQGMGWPACARSMVHWFSDRERGTKMAIWNLAHNVGGALSPLIAGASITYFTIWMTGSYNPDMKASHIWNVIFYVPAIFSLICAVFVIWFLRDTPQSEGLPPIEEFKNDYPEVNVDDRERELSGKEILVNYVIKNKYIWILAIANVAVYIVRYGVVNWAPTYLTEVKGYTITHSAIQAALYEFAGIFGMLLSGWASDKFFHGRRAPMMVFFMSAVSLAVLVYWLNPKGNFAIDSIALFAIGFLIYGPVMLIGIAAVDLVPKKAAGTAAGLTGLFGYLGATVAEVGLGAIVQKYGWNTGFIFLLASCVISIFFLVLLWNTHNRKESA